MDFRDIGPSVSTSNNDLSTLPVLSSGCAETEDDISVVTQDSFQSPSTNLYIDDEDESKTQSDNSLTSPSLCESLPKKAKRCRPKCKDPIYSVSESVEIMLRRNTT